jgi:Na+-translocating ferredoxin:NAD+ oxidoreductase RNF subunit RnfB
MDMIIIAVISVTAIGAVCAIMLCTASKLMYVKVNERLVKIQDCLPGTNCGACGFPGCAGYAEELINDRDLRTNLCTPGGADVLAQLNAILGIETTDAVTAKLAYVRCRGDLSAQKKKMEYKGIRTCAAAKQVFGGEGACAFGCIGYGDCKVVCQDDAICMENGIVRINPRLCTGCTMCVRACPNKLITIENATVKPVVMCVSCEKGAVVRKKCLYGCIGCKKCVRECPFNAIAIENNLAIINYTECVKCGHCAEVCVTNCIQFSKAGNVEVREEPHDNM